MKLSTQTRDRDQILQWIKTELEAGRGIPPELVEEGTMLTQDLGLDSLDLVALRTELEAEYEVVIPDDSLDSIYTIADVIDCLIEHSAVRS